MMTIDEAILEADCLARKRAISAVSSFVSVLIFLKGLYFRIYSRQCVPERKT